MPPRVRKSHPPASPPFQGGRRDRFPPDARVRSTPRFARGRSDPGGDELGEKLAGTRAHTLPHSRHAPERALRALSPRILPGRSSGDRGQLVGIRAGLPRGARSSARLWRFSATHIFADCDRSSWSPGFGRSGSPKGKMSRKHGAVSTPPRLERERSLARARWQGASELSRSNERARITRPCGNTNAVSTNTDSR